MMLTEDIHRFITERTVSLFEPPKQTENGVNLVFTMNYYDTYALLALTKKHIEYLDEEILKAVKIHQNKLYFKVSFEPNMEHFELDAIIFGSPKKTCIRVATDIIRILGKHNVGAHIANYTNQKNKSTYTHIDLVKMH
jgi:hypothetical protein